MKIMRKNVERRIDPRNLDHYLSAGYIVLEDRVEKPQNDFRELKREEEGETSVSSPALKNMTNKALKALCKERGIEYRSKATKAELIKSLKA